MLKRLLALAALPALGSCSLAYDVHAVFLDGRFAFVLANDSQDSPGDCGVWLAIHDQNGPIFEMETRAPLAPAGADCPDLFPAFWGQPPLGDSRRPMPRLELGRTYLIIGSAGAGTISGAFIAERRGDRIFVDNLAPADPRRQEAERRRWPPRLLQEEREQEQLNAR